MVWLGLLMSKKPLSPRVFQPSALLKNLTEITSFVSSLTCVASVSARVRRESWEESKKRNWLGRIPPSIFFFCSRSNFHAITRLETLATQAISSFARDQDMEITEWTKQDRATIIISLQRRCIWLGKLFCLHFGCRSRERVVASQKWFQGRGRRV